ncbi:glycosyltransferase family 61 protein [Fibrella aquatilis]|uniref:Glycosyltransferase family 61 protein n=1 Tax=Fibrella aquatilis TaxID=2817059 RepID=A0A939G4P7_9BACT|nr:glycosyltransferase family 61 protein [Fibrella aquatilis]MBO0932059.1 glycosyltransferase family 61 protein [Fibrella aquatilis]
MRLLGRRLLTKDETEARMLPYQIYAIPKVVTNLEAVVDLVQTDKVMFDHKREVTAPDFVWRYPNTDRQAGLLRCGALRIGQSILNTDFGNSVVLQDRLRPTRRRVVQADVLIAPWSHYWGGYFDYLLFIAAKLCRIKQALPPDVFGRAVVAYPLFHTDFERELLHMIGFSDDRIYDTRKVDVQFDECVVANNSSWFYPSFADVQCLKRNADAYMSPQPTADRRLYIRRAGRRRVIYEEPLLERLRAYGFEIIDDLPRSVAEQYALYSSASVVVGPHGASFANILWCRPGTRLFELFPAGYMPEYFRYLAPKLSMPYAAYCHGPVQESHHSNVDQNVVVDPDELMQRLDVLLATV